LKQVQNGVCSEVGLSLISLTIKHIQRISFSHWQLLPRQNIQLIM
jgi:hypothetical protein